MTTSRRWTRRRALQLGGVTVAGGLAAQWAGAFAQGEPLRDSGEAFFVFVAVNESAPEEQGTVEGIRVFAVRDHSWRAVHVVPSRKPSSLAVSADGRLLFVTNGVDSHQGLPTGSVESWAIAPDTGQLTLLSRQGLALAAVFPTQVAVSPDCSSLAVAAAKGSSCTVLPVYPGGVIGEPVAVRKELLAVGYVLSTPHLPVQLCFTPGERLLAADFRRGLLSMFTKDADRLDLVHREALPSHCQSASFQVGKSDVLLRLQDQTGRELEVVHLDAAALGRRGVVLQPGQTFPRTSHGSSATASIAGVVLEGRHAGVVHGSAGHGSGLFLAAANLGFQSRAALPFALGSAMAWVRA